METEEFSRIAINVLRIWPSRSRKVGFLNVFIVLVLPTANLSDLRVNCEQSFNPYLNNNKPYEKN